MGELDALEDDLAAEATTSGTVPAYLQVGGGAGLGPCCAAGCQCTGARNAYTHTSPARNHVSNPCIPSSPYTQDVELPEVPQGQAQQAQAADEFGLPAIPQRT